MTAEQEHEAALVHIAALDRAMIIQEIFREKQAAGAGPRSYFVEPREIEDWLARKKAERYPQ